MNVVLILIVMFSVVYSGEYRFHLKKQRGTILVEDSLFKNFVDLLDSGSIIREPREKCGFSYCSSFSEQWTDMIRKGETCLETRDTLNVLGKSFGYYCGELKNLNTGKFYDLLGSSSTYFSNLLFQVKVKNNIIKPKPYQRKTEDMLIITVGNGCADVTDELWQTVHRYTRFNPKIFTKSGLVLNFKGDLKTKEYLITDELNILSKKEFEDFNNKINSKSEIQIRKNPRAGLYQEFNINITDVYHEQYWKNCKQ